MARGVNKVILIGNLGADPEVRHTPSGTAVSNITLATSSAWRDKQSGQKQEQTEWHRIVFFNRLAEIVGEYLHKGSKIYIEGSKKDKPIIIPIDAIAFVRFSSQVKSATNAKQVLPIAPEPCIALPAITPQIEVDNAATILPNTNNSSPMAITGFRPIRSDKAPKGNWKQACVKP